MSETTCKNCNKNFSSIYTLKRHINSSKKCINKHNKNDTAQEVEKKVYECELCNKKFKLLSILKNHINS